MSSSVLASVGLLLTALLIRRLRFLLTRRKVLMRCRERDGCFGHPFKEGRGEAADSSSALAMKGAGPLRRWMTAASLNCAEAGAYKVWAASAALGALAGLVAGSAAVALVGFVAGALGPPLLLAALRSRGERVVLDSLPGFLERVAQGLRADVSSLAAIAEAHRETRPPLREELAVVLGDVQSGRPLPAALERWRRRRSHPDVGLAVAALSIGAAAGGRRAQAIDGVAATLRAGRNTRSELAALSLQGKASALIIALLPLGFLLLDSLIGGSTLGFLLGSSLGLVCLGAGILLDAAAFFWMYRITRAG